MITIGRRIEQRVMHEVATLVQDERGSATAEYAVATMAAVGFAGLLVAILRGDEVRGILTDLIRRALTANG
jgi:Flp pilus assembly pilin Flp